MKNEEFQLNILLKKLLSGGEHQVISWDLRNKCISIFCALANSLQWIKTIFRRKKHSFQTHNHRINIWNHFPRNSKTSSFMNILRQLIQTRNCHSNWSCIRWPVRCPTSLLCAHKRSAVVYNYNFLLLARFRPYVAPCTRINTVCLLARIICSWYAARSVHCDAAACSGPSISHLA